MEDSEFAIVNEWLSDTNSIEMFSLDLIDMITSRKVLRNIIDYLSEMDDEFSDETFWKHIDSGDHENVRIMMEDTFSKIIEKMENYNKGIDHVLKILRDETKIQELGESMIPIYERIKKLKI